MNYQIIATLGPSSFTQEIWQKMLATGVTAFRINTSHLELDQVLAWLDQIIGFYSSSENQIPIILDLQGSKWRIGQIESQMLEAGQEIELIYGNASQSYRQIPVPHSDFFKAITQSSNEIVLNDAKVFLTRIDFGPDWMRARVIQGGEIKARKGITYVNSEFRNENLTEMDLKIHSATQDLPQIQYALSYIRDFEEMVHYRNIFGAGKALIAKIERPSALDEVFKISELANTVWLCRGDLGAELGAISMAKAVSRFTRHLKRLPVPVLMAGQVLEHMSSHPQPTRTEVCYLLDCLQNGYNGFVLSDETAIGRFPVESCEAAALFRKSESM